ncbi:hypothetical protein NDU88_007159 [Pleurodeles waltl]|uniref:Uncharacterized protein n=1 Tax=Pleurodeles waltl TaxID=8319 RepID=A0AAV7WGK2_PLEWA|nr:hypothetical protein NDU88_007159 [Pleurodeles waltl]
MCTASRLFRDRLVAPVAGRGQAQHISNAAACETQQQASWWCSLSWPKSSPQLTVRRRATKLHWLLNSPKASCGPGDPLWSLREGDGKKGEHFQRLSAPPSSSGTVRRAELLFQVAILLRGQTTPVSKVIF